MRRRREFLVTVAILLSGAAMSGSAQAGPRPARPLPVYLETPVGQKPRVVITADPELDDLNSLVRYLLYSTDFRTEGLIYASSQFHWTGDGKERPSPCPGASITGSGRTCAPVPLGAGEPGERFIDEAVEHYAEAYPNLRVHNHDYPAPALLKSKISGAMSSSTGRWRRTRRART